MTGKVRKVVGIFLTALLAVVLGAAPAQAATSNATQHSKAAKADYTYRLIWHKMEGQCLDSDGHDLYLNPCNGDNRFQHWRIAPARNGVNIIHRLTGNCLARGGGDSVFMVGAYCGAEYAQWYIDYPNIISVADGACLDGAGNDVYALPCTPNNPYQRYSPVPTNWW